MLLRILKLRWPKIGQTEDNNGFLILLPLSFGATRVLLVEKVLMTLSMSV